MTCNVEWQHCSDENFTGGYQFDVQQRKQPNQAHATRMTYMPTSGLVSDRVLGALPVFATAHPINQPCKCEEWRKTRPKIDNVHFTNFEYSSS